MLLCLTGLLSTAKHLPSLSNGLDTGRLRNITGLIHSSIAKLSVDFAAYQGLLIGRATARVKKTGYKSTTCKIRFFTPLG
jgi:hypothetical protein